MPPKKKFKVKNPGKPIMISKAPTKKKKLVLKKKPKVEEKPKPKKKKLVVKKKLVGTLKPSDILTDEYLFREERNVEETMGYVDFDWIKGISMKDVEFYRKHQRNFDSLSEKKRDRIETIEEKVNENLRPSLEKQMLKTIKNWITNNKDENMTLSQARKKWADTYF